MMTAMAEMAMSSLIKNNFDLEQYKQPKFLNINYLYAYDLCILYA